MSDNNDGSDNWRWLSSAEDPTVTWLEWQTNNPVVTNAKSVGTVTYFGIESDPGTDYQSFICEIRIPSTYKFRFYKHVH